MDHPVPLADRVAADQEVALLHPPADPGRRQLLWQAPGSLFTEQVAGAWARRGRASDLAAVTGPWGVILWDPASRSHVLAVDPLGLQPLYWARTTGGQVAVASWLARLVDRPDVSDELDPEGVLLRDIPRLWGPQSAHRTRFAAVQRVPAGHVVVIDAAGRDRRARYWDPRDLPGPDPSLDLHDSAELLRASIDTAVARLLPGTGRVGAHVSGGLDSSAVACRAHLLLAESGQGLVAGYSWSPSTEVVARFPGDERGLLDEITDMHGFPVRTADMGEPTAWFSDLDRYRYPWVWIAIDAYQMPRMRADGVEVVLSGLGGDEAASHRGGDVAGELVRHGRLGPVWSQARERHRLMGEQSLRPVAREVAGALAAALPGQLGGWRYPRDTWIARRHTRAVTSELAKISPEIAAAYTARAEARSAPRNHHQRQLALLAEGHLQERVDAWYQRSRLMGLSFRYPLLDVNVISTALRLPWWAYASQGWRRPAFRLAVEPWVPANVAWNPYKSEPSQVRGPEPMRPIAHGTDDGDELARTVRELRSLMRPPNLRVRALASAPVHPRPDAAIRSVG